MVTSNIHYNLLKPSDMDTVELGYAVEQRFLDLTGAYLRIHGVYLAAPVQLDRDMLRWREMRVRHKAGDLRNTEAELKSTQAIAQWTCDCQCELRNQTPTTIEWRE